MKKKNRASIFAFAILFTSGASAGGATATECFQFLDANTPSALADLDLQHAGSAPLRKWCYQKKNYGSNQTIFIFNADSSTPKPELSALVQLDAKGEARTMSIGSLAQGKISFHQLPSLALNPYAIPLVPAQARILAAHPVEANTLSATANTDLTDQISNQHWLFATATDSVAVQAGDYSSAVSESAEPFNGFWWSNEGVPMATGPNSPLGIYDASTAARTGKNPNSVAWEQQNHSDVSTSWGGHCNGWTASTQLYAEPTQTLYDSLTHTMVTPYAQKGMLAEASFCVSDAFYGKRYTGPADDLLDIYPDLFHQTLVHYIHNLGKTVSMDYDRGIDIDNNVITGYQFHIVQTADTAFGLTFHVNTVLTVAQYDVHQEDSLGKAATYEKSYAYTLTTDKKGNITGGKWDADSDNPDFLWVALSPAETCPPRNPQVSPAQVSKLFAAFSVPQSTWLPLNFTVNTAMAPQDQVAVPLQIVAGDHLQLSVQVQEIQPASNPGVVLIVSGDSRYPVTGGEKESMFIALPPGSSTLALDHLLSIDSIAVVNQSTTVTSNVNVTFQGLQYLAP
jgi:hypothetical protein